MANNQALFLYPLGEIDRYEDTTYIFHGAKRKSKLPVIWIAEKLGDVEKIIFVITKKTKGHYYNSFRELYAALTSKEFEKKFSEEGFSKEQLEKIRSQEDFDEDKELFSSILKQETNFVYDFLVIDEDNLIGFVHDLKRVIEQHSNYKIHIDITHGYRYIPMFLTIVVTLFKNLGKELSIGEVLYAEGVPKTENKIISLKDYLKALDWSHGVYAFKNFINLYPLRDLLSDNSGISERLERLQSALDMNLAYEIKTSLQELKEDINKMPSDIVMFSLIRDDLENLLNEFVTNASQADFELSLARWHLKNRRYLHGYAALIEAIITKITQTYYGDSFVNKRENRDKAKSLALSIRDDNKELSEEYKKFVEENIESNVWLKQTQKSLSIVYDELANIRNRLAHVRGEETTKDLYEKIKTFAETMNLKDLNRKIQWERIEEMFKEIEKLPSYFSVEKLKELSSIYERMKQSSTYIKSALALGCYTAPIDRRE